MLLGGALALGGGLAFKFHRSRCLRILLITSGSSMNAILRILPWHFGLLLEAVICVTILAPSHAEEVFISTLFSRVNPPPSFSLSPSICSKPLKDD